MKRLYHYITVLTLYEHCQSDQLQQLHNQQLPQPHHLQRAARASMIDSSFSARRQCSAHAVGWTLHELLQSYTEFGAKREGQNPRV